MLNLAQADQLAGSRPGVGAPRPPHTDPDRSCQARLRLRRTHQKAPTATRRSTAAITPTTAPVLLPVSSSLVASALADAAGDGRAAEGWADGAEELGVGDGLGAIGLAPGAAGFRSWLYRPGN